MSTYHKQLSTDAGLAPSDSNGSPEELTVTFENVYKRIDSLVSALEKNDLEAALLALERVRQDLSWVDSEEIRRSSEELGVSLTEASSDPWPMVWQLLDDVASLRADAIARASAI